MLHFCETRTVILIFCLVELCSAVILIVLGPLQQELLFCVCSCSRLMARVAGPAGVAQEKAISFERLDYLATPHLRLRLAHWELHSSQK